MARPRLTLVTPVLTTADAFGPALAAACAAGDVASVLLRLAPAEERALVNLVKALAPAAQEAGAAVLVAGADPRADLATVAARGGADGIHVEGGGDDSRGRLAELRERLGRERILGVGGLRSRHDAMEAGEAGVDYLMFGEPRPDGSIPDAEFVIERAAWWAGIFETPCIAVASSPAEIAALVATGAEFVGLVLDGSDPLAGVRAALEALALAGPDA